MTRVPLLRCRVPGVPSRWVDRTRDCHPVRYLYPRQRSNVVWTGTPFLVKSQVAAPAVVRDAASLVSTRRPPRLLIGVEPAALRRLAARNMAKWQHQQSEPAGKQASRPGMTASSPLEKELEGIRGWARERRAVTGPP